MWQSIQILDMYNIGAFTEMFKNQINERGLVILLRGCGYAYCMNNVVSMKFTTAYDWIIDSVGSDVRQITSDKGVIVLELMDGAEVKLGCIGGSK